MDFTVKRDQGTRQKDQKLDWLTKSNNKSKDNCIRINWLRDRRLTAQLDQCREKYQYPLWEEDYQADLYDRIVVEEPKQRQKVSVRLGAHKLDNRAVK